MQKILLAFIAVVVTLNLTAQDQQEKKKWVKVGGFVNYNMFYDSREMTSAVDGLFQLYPKDEFITNGFDIYDNASLTMLSVGSRMRAEFFGPEVWGAETSGKIEFDFTVTHGVADIRFRHAYGKLDWEKSSLLVGRSWHPFFTTSCFPTTLSINTGAPFQPFNRSTQVTYRHALGNFRVMGAIASQMDYTSPGPFSNSSNYMRDALIPEVVVEAMYVNGGFLIGVAGEVKTLKPRTTTTGFNDSIYSTNETITTFAAKLFTKYKTEKIEVKMATVYGQNLPEFLMLGGYGVATYDSVTGAETYTALTNLNIWGEFLYGKKFRAGLFAGYFKNLGSSESFYSANEIWGRGTNIDHHFRITPMLIYRINDLQFGIELQHDIVSYGTLQLQDGEVTNSHNISGDRIFFDVKFFF